MQKLLATAAVVFAAITLCGAESAAPQTAQYKRDVSDSLAKAVTITEAVATAAAQERVPKGTIAAMQLEREKGHLMYSYDSRRQANRASTK